MRARTIKNCYLVHKWTSLICTAFLLMLCITGLPLIFYEELDHWLDPVETSAMPADTPQLSIDKIVAAGLAQYPGEVIQFVSWDEEDPNIIYLSVNKTPVSPFEDGRLLIMDARTAEVVQEPELDSGFLYVMLTLHIEMFAGLPGKLFLGVMGLLFVVATVSGVVLYAPFMRRLDFGTVRRQSSTKVKWLDLHNLLGAVTIVWVLVVGATGVINTWADLVLQLWRFDQLAEMVGPYQGKAPVEHMASLDASIAEAHLAAPGMSPSFVAFPGTLFSSNHHYMVAMHGDTPLTKRLIQPVLIDAETTELTDTRQMPWYVTALLVSQPLHFGDYGGLPLKIIWALLDILAIVILGSGLYLWLAKRRQVPLPLRAAQAAEEGRA